MLRRTLKITEGVRGSAIIMALVAVVVLATLALAIISLSVSNLSVNQTDAMNNDAYYAAESGVNNAIDRLKQEVADYYNAMLEADDDFDYLYDNFFSEINGNVNGISPPEFDNGLSVETIVSVGDPDEENVGVFLISCTATAPDGSKYQVDAKLPVTRLDVEEAELLEFYKFDGNEGAYVVGGTLTLNSGYGVYNGGSVYVSALNNPKNQYYYVQPPGSFNIDAGTANAVNDCVEYPSYTNPTLTATYTVTTNNVELNGNTVNPATGKKLFDEGTELKPTVIISNPGISFKIGWGCPKFTTIYQRGSGTLTLSCSNANNTIICYSDGNVISSNGPVWADIYCRGNVSTSGNFTGNIICDGNCTEACNSFTGSIKSGGSITCSGGLSASFFAVGPISISNGNQGNNVVYSKTKVTLGSGNYQNVIVFSGGDVDINGGSSLTGAIIAKGNVNQNSWLTLNYSAAVIQTIKDAHQFFFPIGGSSGGGGGTGEIKPDQSVIGKIEIIPIGRVN